MHANIGPFHPLLTLQISYNKYLIIKSVILYIVGLAMGFDDLLWSVNLECVYVRVLSVLEPLSVSMYIHTYMDYSFAYINSVW